MIRKDLGERNQTQDHELGWMNEDEGEGHREEESANRRW